ncbi:uncharacterized protein LOC132702572 isoform X2 [Cylas formicarius]|uniref:uncharacterized protein LOC132702572 isoform X2 n=1 Tax=Cylas formicarius TaxID=197179 RepID=UPI002958CE03|nr:uncharacterized protein LOC132702572 isoform X2 [Cylas formicarius]
MEVVNGNRVARTRPRGHLHHHNNVILRAGAKSRRFSNGVGQRVGRIWCRRTLNLKGRTGRDNLHQLHRKLNRGSSIGAGRCAGSVGGEGRKSNGDPARSSGVEHDDAAAVGKFTREVYNAICLRLGDTSHIPEESVQALFNDMHLFPSDTQISKMLQCARQYSRRNGASQNYLTFGEFCFFIREMRNQGPKSYKKPLSQQKANNKCLSNKCEVFLGGSCNPTTWRADTAIPELQKHGISFYNPQVSIWAPELLAQEHDAKQSASVLLFMIDSQTRSTVGMVEVAYLVASGRCVIVVAQPYRIGQSIMGEIISDKEYYDLVEGQKSLLDLVRSRGVQIHTSLSTALQCTAKILRNVTLNETSAEDQLTYKLRFLREVYDSYGGEMQLYDVRDAYRKITNGSVDDTKLRNYCNSRPNTRITFEQFCALMAELSTDGCRMCTTDAWATQSFQRQCSTNNNNNPSNCIVEQARAPPPPAAGSRGYDVFLGGSLSTGTKWRDEIAVPVLARHHLEYYNPAVRELNGSSSSAASERNGWESSVAEWKGTIDRCKVALFVITSDTRSLTSMILAAHYIGSGKEVVLCVQQLPMEGCVVANETLTKNAVKDYNRARAYLRDVAERRQVPVYDDVADAAEAAAKRAASL